MGTLNVSDTFSWTAGDMNGTGRTVLGSGVVGSITMPSETSMVALSQRTLVNRGSVTFARGRVFGRDAGWIENEGTFRMNAESTDGLYNWVGTQPTFKNTGTVEKTAGSGRSVVGFRFDNRGAVRATSGFQAFSGGATAQTSDGSWDGSGGVISFDGGAFSVGRWDMAGSIRFRGSTVTASGLTAPAADIEISGGSLTVTDDAVASHVRGLALTGGSLGGAGTLNVSQTFSWTAGDMNGTGRTVLGSGVTGSIAMPSETSMVALSQRTLVNRGVVTFSRGRVFGRDAGSIENEGTFRMNAESGDGLYNWVGAQPTFKNTGSFEKTAGSGRSVVGFRFDNRGAVHAESASWRSAAARPHRLPTARGPAAAPVRCASRAVVQRRPLEPRRHDQVRGQHRDGIRRHGAGRGRRISGGSLTVTDAGADSQVRGLALLGGSLGGAGTLTVSESFLWTAGDMNGTGAPCSGRASLVRF